MESVSRIEETLAALLDPANFPQGQLAEAAFYSVNSGGKRVRPRIVLATAELFGTPVEHAIIPACAIELLHTFSLIHDDLPSLDNDDFRRGHPTLHKVYPEGHALLTGDFLLNYTYELLSRAPHLTADQRLRLIDTLAHHTGAHGMIGGQEADIAGRAATLSALFDQHKRKTAALFTAAFEFGGIIGNAAEMNYLTTLGQNFGLLFQLIDDLNDGDGVVSLLGPQAAEQLVSDHHQNLLNLLAPISHTSLSELLIKSISLLPY